ncbi:hypothetical protein GPLA_1108 [Paraglaciecola polaris LMG 21857]|uniref:Uncharacterized protein n=1 Tax=Paraglaciecola polaris LMG 21857 TaxID=1129793 RepID=K6ZT70_9ALTE|nr:hypothetical protein GPLA_1108 [Paraglaciecola polaris LMG 21857]
MLKYHQLAHGLVLVMCLAANTANRSFAIKIIIKKDRHGTSKPQK